MTLEHVPGPTQNTDQCFEAALLNHARSVHPSDIPEGYDYFRAEGYKCPYISQKSGKECTMSNPMVFMEHNVGFVAIGTTNFCKMQSEAPRRFNREASPSLKTRIKNIGKSIVNTLT